MDRKRERGRNYTEFEKEILLDIVKKYYTIVENKQTDCINVKAKVETWDKIAREFNLSSQTGPRNGMQLKLLYEGIKKKVKKDRKEQADDKVEMDEMNGGSQKKLDKISEKYVNLMENIKTEIPNFCDSTDPLDEITEPRDTTDNFEMFTPTILGTSPSDLQQNAYTQAPFSPPTIEESCSSSLPTKNKHPYLTQSKANRHKNQNKEESSNYRQDANKIKLEILEIRKKKEQAQLELLLLQVKEKELELKRKYNL